MSTHKTTDHSYSIKEASKLTGLPSSTLRYYESIGIINHIDRDSSSKHRVYTQQDLNILDTIACLNATGMALEDMRTYIDNATAKTVDVEKQIELLRSQADRLKLEAQHIKLRQQYVELKIEYWQAVMSNDRHYIEEASVKAKALAQELKKL